jgi:hypothetical protein
MIVSEDRYTLFLIMLWLVEGAVDVSSAWRLSDR